MKTMSKSLAKGSKVRILSGGTQLAGKSLFLPTEGVPVVVQTLTRNQISAIPKERFSVREFGAESRGRIITAMKIASTLSGREMLGVVTIGDSAIGSQYAAIKSVGTRNVKTIRVNHSSFDDAVHRSVRTARRLVAGHKMASLRTHKCRKKGGISAAYNKSIEERILTITTILGQLQSEVNDLHSCIHATGGNNDSVPPSRSDIFKPGIDEERMGECIVMARQLIIGEKESCTIYGLKIKLVDFCVLTHLTLDRMHFLENTAQKPFCEYLKKEDVFGKEAPQVRNFNVHANKSPYKGYGDVLKKIAFDPSTKPIEKFKSDLCYMACHKIAQTFHGMDYFKTLRSHKESFEPLVL